ncbi:MAG: TRAP transporter large permease [Proteobacteria bacterium]|nr:TRAP transporter large permease [Pseudomonadota bacterium]MDA1059695.1 TRAP transporter large permease [Pseudomonadota bacterium]
MSALLIGVFGLVLLFVLIILHVPIGVSMGLTGFVTIGYLIGFGPATGLFGAEGHEVVSSEGLAVVAVFILMGAFANLSGLAQDMYRLAYAFLGHMRGGLALATVGGCAGFGSVSGSSVATTATMTRIALPEMMQRGYSITLSTGSIAAGGTLGMLIPPSIVMIIYGILTEQFIIALFAAALIPGLLSVLVYFAAIRTIVFLNPAAGPAGPRVPWSERLQILKQSWGVVTLAAIVSGGLYSGIVTPAESASVGVSIAFLFAVFRGKVNWTSFFETLLEAAATTGMIYVIIIGAHIFSFFMTLSGLPEFIVGAIEGSGLSRWAILILLYVMFLFLGSIFDTIAAMVITLPFVFPLIISLGFDPIWWGVINVIVMEIGMITPPIGMNVFIMHGMAKHIPLRTIFRGIAPFAAADLVRLALVTAFPALALWLPEAWGYL